VADDQPHDHLFQYVFADVAQAQAHLRAHLPSEIAAAVRWDTRGATVAQVAASPDGASALRALFRYIALSTRAPPPDDVVERIRVVLPRGQQEDFMTWADQLRTEGRLEGTREVLRRLLERRFGPLPDDVARQVAGATLADLEV
jgi:hypothetical protein